MKLSVFMRRKWSKKRGLGMYWTSGWATPVMDWEGFTAAYGAPVTKNRVAAILDCHASARGNKTLTVFSLHIRGSCLMLMASLLFMLCCTVIGHEYTLSYTKSIDNSYINMNVPNCTKLALFIDWHQIQNETFHLAKTENNVSVIQFG